MGEVGSSTAAASRVRVSPAIRDRLAPWFVNAALFFMVVALAGGIYEHVVLDAAWPTNPALIQPGHGGVDRKVFWIPVHTAITVTLLGSLWSVWRRSHLRRLVFLGAALYVVMRVWTAMYFIPVALELETTEVFTDETKRRAWTWVAWSMAREPLVVGACIALWLAARRLEPGRPAPAS